MLRVRVTTRLLVVHGCKKRVRGNAGLERRMCAGGGVTSGIGTVGARILNGGEKLRGGLSIGSIIEGKTVVTAGSTL